MVDQDLLRAPQGAYPSAQDEVATGPVIDRMLTGQFESMWAAVDEAARKPG